MSDRISDLVSKLRKEGRDEREEERLNQRVKFMPTRVPEGKKTTQPELPAVEVPRPMSATAARMVKVNELYERRHALSKERSNIGGGMLKMSLIKTTIGQKATALQEWGRLLNEAGRTRDPEEERQLRLEAEGAKVQAEAFEAQIEAAKADRNEERKIDEAIASIDAELQALGVHVPAPTPRRSRLTDALAVKAGGADE